MFDSRTNHEPTSPRHRPVATAAACRREVRFGRHRQASPSATVAANAGPWANATTATFADGRRESSDADRTGEEPMNAPVRRHTRTYRDTTAVHNERRIALFFGLPPVGPCFRSVELSQPSESPARPALSNAHHPFFHRHPAQPRSAKECETVDA